MLKNHWFFHCFAKMWIFHQRSRQNSRSRKRYYINVCGPIWQSAKSTRGPLQNTMHLERIQQCRITHEMKKWKKHYTVDQNFNLFFAVRYVFSKELICDRVDMCFVISTGSSSSVHENNMRESKPNRFFKLSVQEKVVICIVPSVLIGRSAFF